VLSDLKEGKVTLPLIFALRAEAARDGNGHDGNGAGERCVGRIARFGLPAGASRRS
jgi:geranylgeranyl pyrophosphate synthase